MNMQPCCPMMQIQYPSYEQMTRRNYNPCTNCFYRNYNNMNYGYDYPTEYYNSSNTVSNYPEMKAVLLEEILE